MIITTRCTESIQSTNFSSENTGSLTVVRNAVGVWKRAAKRPRRTEVQRSCVQCSTGIWQNDFFQTYGFKHLSSLSLHNSMHIIICYLPWCYTVQLSVGIARFRNRKTQKYNIFALSCTSHRTMLTLPGKLS